MQGPPFPADGLRAAMRGLGHWQRSKRRGSAIVFTIAILLLALLSSAVVQVMAAARAYASGESAYSRGQKSAVRWLGQYLRSGDEAAFLRYQAALAIPLGDRAARLELDRPHPDDSVVRRGLLQGGNDGADFDVLVGFYRLFRHVPPVDAVIDTWRAADADLLRLQQLGERLHAAAGAVPDPAARAAFEAEMLRLDDALDANELRFSHQLGDAARWVQRTVLLATAGLALTLVACGLLFARMMWMRLARSQQAIEAGNARWTLAADAGGFGLVEWRAADDTVRLDPRAAAIHELDPGRPVVPARLLRRCVHPEDRAPMKRTFVGAVASGAALVQRYRVVLAGGRVRHLEVDGRAFRARDGRLSHMVGLVRDVTEEVRLQDAMLEEGTAQRAYQAKREFLSRVSHELRTPLNAVIGFSDLMRIDAAEPLTPTQAARLARVVDGGQYLLRLVNDLLDVARLEVGELSISLASLPLAPVLRSVVDLLEPARAARGVSVALDEPPASLVVVADPVRLKQVFVNILSNAIKYNRVGGTVFVGLALTPTQAVVSVRDQGAGMSAQQQRELFIPFRRPGDDAGATEGAGLGLVISRHLAERQGGSLDVASAPGQGTTVTIRVNRDLASAAPAADFEPSASQGLGLGGAAGVIVYVEDDPVNVLLIEQYVAQCPDVHLVVARDGAAGLELVRRWLPDLVLLDMQLPDMSGLEVLDRLRADPLTRGLRVVALSADAMPAQVAEAIARGAEAYWTKPLSLQKFRRELPALMSR